jgi:NhaP-type Na+/H+ or K+/H+ antiporter
MNNFNVLIALMGGVILSLGLASKWLSRSPFPPTLIALVIGIAIGPEALGFIDLDAQGEQSSHLERLTRLTLGIGLVGVALRVPSEYPRRNWREMAWLIGLGMPLMWSISTLLVYFMLDLSFWLAALIGAVITPTDPVAATSIVTGQTAEQNIPDRIRHAISFESGANDGLSYFFVFLPFLMLTEPLTEAVSHWFLKTLLWEVGAATGFGLLIGYIAGALLRKAEQWGAIEDKWRLVYTVALGLFAAGAGKLIHSDEVLVVFAAAAMFDQVVSAPDRKDEERGQEAVNRFFSIPIFVLLGTAIPWEGWRELGWNGIGLAIGILLLRRPITLLLLRPLLPGVRSIPDALFMGWFGPIAVSAIYYSALMEKKLSEPFIWDVVSLVICASVVAHGLTGAPVTRLYGKWTGERKRIEQQRHASPEGSREA